eukprot:COSAG05_NODE_1017_length_6171_cov_45.912714_4_plen_73_part_00
MLTVALQHIHSLSSYNNLTTLGLHSCHASHKHTQSDTSDLLWHTYKSYNHSSFNHTVKSLRNVLMIFTCVNS